MKDKSLEEQDKNSEEKEKEPAQDDYVPVEKVSFSFVFFLVAGATLFVTLWSFWDDEYSRRGFKEFQNQLLQ